MLAMMNYILITEVIKVTKFGRTLLFLYTVLVTGMVLSISCVKQKKPENSNQYVPPPELLELDEEELDDLPEDTGEEL